MINRSGHVRFFAIKALILQKIGKLEECRDVAESILETGSDDRMANEILVTVYKTFNDIPQVVRLQETYFRYYPNEQRGRELFEHLGYLFRFVDQQRHALKMYKTFGQMEYVEWTVLAMILLADLDNKQMRMLEIAELLLIKIKTEEGFQYRLPFLRLDLEVHGRLEKFQEGVEVVQENLQVFDDQIEGVLFLARFLNKQNDVYNSLNKYHDILRLNLQESTAKSLWEVQREYIDVLFQLVEKCITEPTRFNNDHPFDPSTQPIKVIDSGHKQNLWKPFDGHETIVGILIAALSNIKNTREVINGKAAIVEEVRRQSVLSELEFKRRLVCYGFSQGPEEYKGEVEPGGAFFGVITKYVTKYYEDSTITEDLTPYLHFLNLSHLEPIRDRLDSMADRIMEISTNRLKCIKCALGCHKVLRTVSAYSTHFLKHIGQLWEITRKFAQYYADFTDFDYVPRRNEIRPEDEFILLSNEIMMQTPPVGMNEMELAQQPFATFDFEQEKDTHFNMRRLFMITLLEIGHRQSPYNNQIKLALMQHYMIINNHTAIQRLHMDMKLRGLNLEKMSFLYFTYINDWRLFLSDLDTLCDQIISFHKGYFLEVIPDIKTAYDDQNISNIKSIYKHLNDMNHSYYKFIADFTKVYLSFYRTIIQPGQQFSRVLRDHLPLLKRVLATNNTENFHITVDLDAIYTCGEINLRKPSLARTRNNYTPEMLKGNPFEHRNRAKPTHYYGRYTKIVNLRLDAICLKLLLDVSERSHDAVDADLRELNRILMQLHYLEKPSLANWSQVRPALFSNRDSGGVKEEARRIREEGLPEPYNGCFDSEASFDEHRKFLDNYIWKFVMMIFEGSFRLISAHTSDGPRKREMPRDEEGKAEEDLTFKLTTLPHISRHFLIIKIMLRDLFNSIVPKEDYLKKLQMGLNSIQVPDENEEEGDAPQLQVIDVEPMYPGMFKVISDFLQRPILYSLLLNTTWINNLPDRVSGPGQSVSRSAAAEQESLDMLRQTIREFYEFIGEALEELDQYLEKQRKVCWYEIKGRDYIKNEVFRIYASTLPEFSTQCERFLQDLKRSHEHIIVGLQKTIRHYKKIPRSIII